MRLLRRRRRPVRGELRYLPYTEADRLIRETGGAWTIAPEEDANRTLGMVYLERLERCVCPLEGRQLLYCDLDGDCVTGGWTHRLCGGHVPWERHTPPSWPVRVFAALAPRRLYAWWFRA